MFYKERAYNHMTNNSLIGAGRCSQDGTVERDRSPTRGVGRMVFALLAIRDRLIGILKNLQKRGWGAGDERKAHFWPWRVFYTETEASIVINATSDNPFFMTTACLCPGLFLL